MRWTAKPLGAMLIADKPSLSSPLNCTIDGGLQSMIRNMALNFVIKWNYGFVERRVGRRSQWQWSGNFSISGHRVPRPPAKRPPHQYFLCVTMFFLSVATAIWKLIFTFGFCISRPRFSIFTFPFLLPSSLIDTRRRWWSFHFRKEMEFFDEVAIQGER